MSSNTSTSVEPTGVTGLDSVLAGGLPRGYLYLVQGTPGTGKTTMALQFLITGRTRGERGLYITLSEARDELEEAANSHHWSLEGIEVHEVLPRADLSNGDDNTLFYPSEVELVETTREILDVVERVHPTRVVIDSLSEIRLLSQNVARYRRQVMALKQFFASRCCTVLLLDDGGHVDPHLQSMAHGVIQLEQLAPVYGPERRRLRILKLRGVKFRGGFHDMKLDTGRILVFPRIKSDDRPPVPSGGRLSSRIPEMDKLLGGGLERGTTVLIMGPAGAGKSAIVSQYAAAAALDGERASLFTFEEGHNTLYQRSAALGIPLAEQVEAGRVRLQRIDPAELTPGEFTELVRVAVDEEGSRIVIIDSLNGYYSAMPEENFLTLQLHELFSFLRQRGVVVFLTLAQHGFLGNIITPIDVSFLADTVVLLRYFEAGGKIHRAISVPKKRSGAHELAIRELALDARGLHVGEPLKRFRGVLSGIPQYVGGRDELLSDDSGDG